MMVELKPCPLCGGVATVHEYNYITAHNFTVYCEDCWLATQAYETEAEAVKAWNTRTERTCRNINRYGTFTCSECGIRLRATQVWDYFSYLEIGKDGEWQGAEGVKFCPNCGAKVVK